MAIAHVQGPAAHLATTSTNVTTFAGNVSAGNLVVVCVCQIYGGNPPRAITSVTDNAGGGSNTYSLAKRLQASSGDAYVDIYYSEIARAGTLSVTVTFTGGSADSAVGINEYSGVDTTPLDVTSSNQGTTSPATPGSVSPTGTCLYVAALTNVNGATVTPPAGWDQRQEIESSSTCPINVHDKITTGAQNPSTTFTGSPGRWVECIVTFNELAAGGGTAYTRIASESLGITDSVSRSIGMTRRPADSLGLSDSANRYAALARRTVESLGITDSTQRYASFLREAQDLLGITDEEVLQAAYLRIFSDSMGLADAAWRSQGHYRVQADALGITDEVSTLIYLLIYRAVSETMGITDSQDRSLAVVRSISDALGISDTLDKASAISRIMSELVGMTDSIDRTMAVIRNLSDQIDMTDSAHRALSQVRFLTEAMGLTDDNSATLAAAAVAVWLMIALSLQRLIRIKATDPFCSIDVARSFISLEAYKL